MFRLIWASCLVQPLGIFAIRRSGADEKEKLVVDARSFQTNVTGVDIFNTSSLGTDLGADFNASSLAKLEENFSASSFADLEEESSSWIDNLAKYAKVAARHDKAHAGHWAALQHAQIIEAPAEHDGADQPNDPAEHDGADLPKGLTVDVNGRELSPTGDSRPGKVNTNRIEVKIMGKTEVAELKVLLAIKGGPGKTLMVRQLEGKAKEAVWCCDQLLPSETALSLTISWVDKARNPSSLEKTWTVATADAVSGDVQVQAAFLPKDYSYNSPKYIGKDLPREALWKKTFTVFDMAYEMDNEEKVFDILTQGFEVQRLDQENGNEVQKLRRTSKEHIETFMTKYFSNGGGMAAPLQLLGAGIYRDSAQTGNPVGCMLWTEKQVMDWRAFFRGEQLQEPLTCYTHPGNIDGKPNFHRGLLTYIKDISGLVHYTVWQVWSSKVDAKTLDEKFCSFDIGVGRGSFTKETAQQFNQRTYVCFKGQTVAIANLRLSYSFLIVHALELASLDVSGRVLAFDKLKRGLQVNAEETLDPETNQKIETALSDIVQLALPIISAQEAEAIEWWKETTSEEVNAACYNFQFRSTHDPGAPRSFPVAHIDVERPDEYPTFLTSTRVTEKLGVPAAIAMNHTELMFNKWINAGDGPIETAPLALLDTTTLEDGDIEKYKLAGFSCLLAIHSSDAHRWYYTDVDRGEAYVFATAPHAEEHHPGLSRASPHTAVNILTPPGRTTKPRRSFEVRCLLVKPDAYKEEDEPGIYVLAADVKVFLTMVGNELSRYEGDPKALYDVKKVYTVDNMKRGIIDVGYPNAKGEGAEFWMDIVNEKEPFKRYAYRRKDVSYVTLQGHVNKGADKIQVTSVEEFAVGQLIKIDNGCVDRETNQIKSIHEDSKIISLQSPLQHLYYSGTKVYKGPLMEAANRMMEQFDKELGVAIDSAATQDDAVPKEIQLTKASSGL